MENRDTLQRMEVFLEEQAEARASPGGFQGEGCAADVGRRICVSIEPGVESQAKSAVSLARGFRPIGRPEWSLENKAKKAEDRITELECKIGQQALVIDFLRRAFKRVEELRQPNKGNGGTASMQRSRP